MHSLCISPSLQRVSGVACENQPAHELVALTSSQASSVSMTLCRSWLPKPREKRWLRAWRGRAPPGPFGGRQRLVSSSMDNGKPVWGVHGRPASRFPINLKLTSNQAVRPDGLPVHQACALPVLPEEIPTCRQHHHFHAVPQVVVRAPRPHAPRGTRHFPDN